MKGAVFMAAASLLVLALALLMIAVVALGMSAEHARQSEKDAATMTAVAEALVQGRVDEAQTICANAAAGRGAAAEMCAAIFERRPASAPHPLPAD